MATEKRLSGKDGFLYYVTYGSEDTSTGALATGEYLVTDVSTGTSGIPTGVTTGYRIYSDTGGTAVTVKSGDKVKLVTKTKLSFVTDANVSMSIEKYDKTTQVDSARSYEVSNKPDITVSVSGYAMVGSTEQEQLLRRFTKIYRTESTGGVTVSNVTADTVWLDLTVNESTVSTYEYAYWALPLVLDGVTLDKPMNGMQPFNFNATVNGEDKPAYYVREIST